MPSGRRIPRSMLRNNLQAVMPNYASDSSTTSARYSPLGGTVPPLPTLEQPAPPKHFPFPSTPVDNDLFFESLMFLFSVVTSGFQFLHLYRTVWWLPQSYTNQAMNFYLIDGYLVMFILILFSRRIVYLIGCKVIEKFVASKFHHITLLLFRMFLFGFICGMLLFCAYFSIRSHQLVYLLYLLYPIIGYLILFGLKIGPFFESVNWNSTTTPPLHACSSVPSNIRQEVENLKSNFNNRLRQILFISVINAYYGGFVPCSFTQSFLYYDIYWASQYAVFIFLSSFMGYFTHTISLRYCDVLHRSALHLGTWEKMDSRNSITYTWNETLLWPNGSIVRHGRDLYKAVGECNAAEPGNAAFSRFYAIFKNPSLSLGVLVILHDAMVLYQMGVLIRCSVWYYIVSLTFLLFFNYYILFKIVRDYLISSKIYREEKLIHDKINVR